jgi:hypothetical protein
MLLYVDVTCTSAYVSIRQRKSEEAGAAGAEEAERAEEAKEWQAE